MRLILLLEATLSLHARFVVCVPHVCSSCVSYVCSSCVGNVFLDSATGGYAESTYFRNLKDSDSFEKERFGMWVSAYSNGPFAPAQASVYLFCGLNACLTGKDGGTVRGFYYSASLGAHTGKYWWNPGRLVREADADGSLSLSLSLSLSVCVCVCVCVDV